MDGNSFNGHDSTTTLARKRRRLLLSKKKLSNLGQNKENEPTSTPTAGTLPGCSRDTATRYPLQSTNSNDSHTLPSQWHLDILQNKKRSRIIAANGVNLFNRFNNADTSPSFYVGESSNISKRQRFTQKQLLITTHAALNNPHTPPDITNPHYGSYPNPNVSRTSYSSDDSNGDSEDCDSFGHNSDSDDSMEPHDILDQHNQSYSDIGDPVWECLICQACMWSGKIVLPYMKQPPLLLEKLLHHKTDPESKNFQANIRTYNAMFSFTSPGMKFDTTIPKGGGPPTMRLHGQTCHRIGSLVPPQGALPQYAQLYIYDTDHEITNRMRCFKDNTSIETAIVAKLKRMLDDNNVLVKAFRMARDMFKANPYVELRLKLIGDRHDDGRVYNMPTVAEVAALIVGDVDTGEMRDLVVQYRSGKLQRIDEFNPSYLSYQYPLIFCYGEDGYRNNILHKYRDETTVTRKNRQSIKDWLCFRLQERTDEPKTLLYSRKLFQQFLVDGYAMMESERLNWLRNNQSKLRVRKYNNLQQRCDQGEKNPGNKQGKRVVLPSSFVGSKRYMDQLYFDGMAISSRLGFPDLFITFTCNPNWPEITRLLSPKNLKPHDRPDIVAKVFNIKFKELMVDLTKKHILGKVMAFMYTIEFQKRGLPHAHILIFFHPQSKYPTPSDIDNIICAEIPDPEIHPALYALVKSHMIHGLCGLSRPDSRCMRNRQCSKYYPKKFIEDTVVNAEGYPLYRRRSNTHVITKNNIKLDNRNVVPYNTRLLLKYQAHINMEWCNQCTSIKYLFKYIHKGYDRIGASVVASKANTGQQHECVDEIKQYLDCRYVSPSEACWRIFSYKVHGRKPAVERMFFHLIGEKVVYYKDCEQMEHVLESASITESMFTSWLVANATYAEARSLTYGEFVTKFVYVKRNRMWKPRKRGFTIGRLVWVPPTTGELFYLRMMLTVAKGPTCYEDIRRVGETQYDTFREACIAMGFLDDDREYICALKEASAWGTGHYLRKLFVVMLLSGAVNRPAHVWKESWILLADGLLYEQKQIANNPCTELCQIEKMLQLNHRTLHDFKPIPYPNDYVIQQLGNRLIYDERQYNIQDMKAEFDKLFKCLTDEQRKIFDQIMDAVNKQQGGVFFLHGYGGTGKTYMWRTLASALRSKHEICLTVATSGIASLLLPGGRTAHSKFKLPVPCVENSTCKINFNDPSAGLLREAKLIIWDEAPMAHKYCFETLDRTLKDVMSNYGNSDTIFGGKVVIFGGDFRQILPVVPGGSRSDIVHSTINASYIWHYVKVLNLTKNMRLSSGPTEQDKKEIADFSDWLLKIGEGRISEPNDGYANIDIPPKLLITDFDDPIQAIVESTYPDFLNCYQSTDYLKNRAILASTLDIVDNINDHILAIMPGEIRDYYSSNSVDRSEIHDSNILQVLSPEFLSSLRTSGLPNHHLKLKVGTPIMLMRNIDQSQGLCNGTRLIITNMAAHVLEAKLMGDNNNGKVIYIPRMDMSPSQSPWPFKLSRRQFPVIVAYAMTINKSQISRPIVGLGWTLYTSRCFHTWTDLCCRFTSYN
ncbi:uncharacterized protein LOC131639412 [Vicia villosa]|uniref:uncharacterized protein LOC131639412 n=1 Tax=Vicia villosa TaxID=3911 RepID=UPI00273AFF97|nr:uncharacterized protein LOC131639412 [Vicia villosa]